MLILKLTDERPLLQKKRLFRKQKQQMIFTRNNITVNGKTHIYIEYPQCMTDEEEFSVLLSRYTGKIVLCNSGNNTIIDKSFLFNPEEYYVRALLSALSKYVATLADKNITLGIRMSTFLDNSESYQVVKVAKRVVFISPETPITQRFKSVCYTTYGAYVNFDSTCVNGNFDIYVDFNMIDEQGKLFINIKGVPTVLYPDPTYFILGEGMSYLVDLGINEKIACAAFNDIS